MQLCAMFISHWMVARPSEGFLKIFLNIILKNFPVCIVLTRNTLQHKYAEAYNKFM